MRIVIDMQPIQSGSRKGGIGRYAFNLFEAIVRNNHEHDIFVLLNENLPMDNYDRLCEMISEKQIYKFSIPGDIKDFDSANQIRLKAVKLIREYGISHLRPDMVLIMSLIEGLYENVVTSVGEFYPSERTAVILYDLIPLVEKEKYLGDPIVEKHYMYKVNELAKAGLLLSISEFSKKEGIELLDISEEKIVNISSAIDDSFKKINISVSEKEKLYQKFDIQKKFLMFTGSFDIRKNHENLIRAFAVIPKSLREDYQLVIIGNGWEEIYKRLKDIAKSAGLGTEEIVFLGHVNDEELLSLYNLCSLFVFPSLREGFGLPVLEAMSCGTPAIGSNVTSIPEVINFDEALFDPKDINDITNKIVKVLEDDKFRKRLISHGIAQSKKFSWDKSAITTLNALEKQHESLTKEDRSFNELSAYDTLIDNISGIQDIKNIDDSELNMIANNMDENLKEFNPEKIGVITSWNTRCGIASYSRFLIDAFKDESVILAPYVEKETLIDIDDQNVVRCWNLENDSFEGLLKVIKNRGLEIILLQFNYGFFDFNNLGDFIELLVKDNIKVYITLHATKDPVGLINKELKILSKPFQKANMIFIHSSQDMINLKAIGVKNNYMLFPQGVLDFDFGNKKINKNKRFLIATNGFFLQSKGLIELMQAVKVLIDDGLKVSLLMLNAEYPHHGSFGLIETAKKFILENHLEKEIVLNTDYLDDKEIIEKLNQTDLIVYPYQKTGESSSAAVRMGIAARKPIAVTPQPIFDDVNDFVFKLPGETVGDLVSGLKEIISIIEKQDLILREMDSKREKWRNERLYSSLSKKLKVILDK